MGKKDIFYLVIKILVSIILIILFIINIDFKKISFVLYNFTFWNLIFIIILTVIRNYFGAYRFYLLLPTENRVKINELSKQYFIAAFFNNFLPTALGGDVVRIWLLNKHNFTKTEASTYILVERLIGFYGLLFISFISSFFWDTPSLIFRIVIYGIVLFTVIIFLFFSIFYNKKFKSKLLNKIKLSLIFFKNKVSTLFISFFLSLVYQFISIYISYYFAVLIYDSISIIPFLTLVPLVWFITMIPVSFGGIGLREISFVYLLDFINITKENALIVSIGTYLSLIISSLIGIYYFYEKGLNFKKIKEIEKR